jgi:hypothetical protein
MVSIFFGAGVVAGVVGAVVLPSGGSVVLAA